MQDEVPFWTKIRFLRDPNLIQRNEVLPRFGQDFAIRWENSHSRNIRHIVRYEASFRVVIPFQNGRQIQHMGSCSDIIPNLAHFFWEPFIFNDTRTRHIIT